MVRHAASLLLLLILASPVAAMRAPVEEEWVAADSLGILRMIDIAKNHPERILELDVFRRGAFEDLGYGYGYRETFTEGGYVANQIQVVVRNKVPVSFAITPRLPYPYAELYDRYRAFYAGLFEIDSLGNPKPWYWHYREVTLPMDDSSYALRFQRQVFRNPLREKIERLMTPYSGIDYACGSRAANTMPSNRMLFEEIAPAMNYVLATCLIRSINPATRLIAIEYLQRYHREKFDRKPMQRDVKKIYRTHPRTRTVDGFERKYEGAEELVQRFVREGCQQLPVPEPEPDLVSTGATK